MSEPWNDYAPPPATASAGPWSDYSAPPAAGPAPQSQSDASAWQQLVAGATKGITGLPDVLGNVMNPAHFAAHTLETEALKRDPKFQAAAKAHGLTPDQAAEIAKSANAPETAQYWLHKGLGLIGLNPDDVRATTAKSRILQGVGAGLSTALVPGGEAATVGNLLRSAAIGAAAGGGSTAAEEAAPAALKPVVGLAAGLASAVATHGAISTGESALGTAGRLADPFIAAASQTAARRQAGQTIANRATDVGAVKTALEPGASELVPGSEPTTFQQTGDLGLGALERETQNRDAVPFKQREEEQGVARTQTIQKLQESGDPNALAAGIRSNFDQVDAASQADLDRLIAEHHANTSTLTADAQQKGAAIGGNSTPEAYGQATRAAITEAETAEKARMGALYKAVNPNDDLVGNMTGTRQAASEIASGVGQFAEPMRGVEAEIFDTASKMPSLAPLKDLTDLRTWVSAASRNELRTNGSTQVYARLTQLKQAIQNNLSHTIAERIANEAGGVDRGDIAAGDSTAARLQSWIDDWAQQRQTGVSGATSTGETAPAGASAGPPGHGAGLPPQGGFPGAAGDPGLPPDAPNIDPDALARLRDATAEYAKYKARFGQPPVSTALARAGGQDLFRLPDGQVPGKFFHPGPTGYSDMQSLFSVVGRDKALPVIADYAAASLRRAAMDDATGTLDPRKFAAWSAKHADALRALPANVRQAFGEAALASGALADATAQATRTITAASASRALLLKDFQKGAIGRVMGTSEPDQVTKVIGNILGAPSATADMKVLAKAARQAGDDAVQGLRRAVADHIAQRFVGNTEAGTTGVSQLKADAFQTFMRKSEPALRTVFSDAEVGSMNAVAQDLQRSARSQNATKIKSQSNTVQDSPPMLRRQAEQVRSLLGTYVGAGAAGAHVGGPLGAMMGLLGAPLIQQMRNLGINRVDGLVTEALLHPEVARELLKKTSPRAAPIAGQRLAATLRRAALASGAATIAASASNATGARSQR